jgi:hypothetical protein
MNKVRAILLHPGRQKYMQLKNHMINPKIAKELVSPFQHNIII